MGVGGEGRGWECAPRWVCIMIFATSPGAGSLALLHSAAVAHTLSEFAPC